MITDVLDHTCVRIILGALVLLQLMTAYMFIKAFDRINKNTPLSL
jgi:hypothetical protein